MKSRLIAVAIYKRVICGHDRFAPEAVVPYRSRRGIGQGIILFRFHGNAIAARSARAPCATGALWELDLRSQKSAKAFATSCVVHEACSHQHRRWSMTPLPIGACQAHRYDDTIANW